MIGGSRLAYHNRLRCADFAKLFEEEGLEVIYRRDIVDKEALSALNSGKLKPHPSYSGYAHVDLAAHIVDIYARRFQTAAVAVRERSTISVA